MGALALTVLLGAATLSALVAFTYFALSNSVGTVVLLLVVWIASTALRDTVDLSVTISDVRVVALDVLSVVLVAIAVVRFLSHGVRGTASGLALLLLLLLVVHIARGIEESGAQESLNSARGWLYFTAALVYTATAPRGWDGRVWKWLAVGGLTLAVIAVPYFLIDGLGASTEQIYRNGELVESRPILAAGTLLILQAAVLAAALRWPSRQTALYVAVGAGISVLLLQHRTLWIAGLLVGVLSFIWWSYRQDNHAKAKVFGATGIVLLLMPVAAWGFVQTGPLIESASEVTRSDSTFIWRVRLWEAYMASNDSTLELVSGTPSASSQSRTVEGDIIEVSPHNGFVDAYVRFGLAGVLTVGWLGVLLWFRRREVALHTGLTAQVVGLLLLTQLVFSVTYSLDVVQGVIAGILVSGLAAASPVGARPASPPPALIPEHAIR